MFSSDTVRFYARGTPYACAEASAQAHGAGLSVLSSDSVGFYAIGSSMEEILTGCNPLSGCMPLLLLHQEVDMENEVGGWRV